MGAAQLAAEVRRAVARGLRRRVAELDTPSFENLCSTLLERMGMRDVRVAKRSKEGPLYLARQRRGVSDLRVAVKLVRGAREIGRNDVQELRKDLAHYSAQMGLVLAPGEAGRDARSEASAAGQAPVALYVGDALPEELIACRVGVTVQSVEVPDLDEAFLAGLSRHREERRPRDRHEQQEEARQPGADTAAPQPAHEEVAQEPAPAEAAVQEPPPLEAPAESESGPAPEAAAAPGTPPPDSAVPGEAREPRRRRGGREERPRATTASEQAWGQPAGTLRFAAPPGPTVVAPGEPRQAPPGPAEGQEDDAAPPADLPKSDPV